MLYCDKPEWCGCTEKQIEKLASEIKKQIDGANGNPIIGDVEIYEDCGTLHAWYDYDGESGKISNVEVGLEWADRDGDSDVDDAIQDTAAAEKILQMFNH